MIDFKLTDIGKKHYSDVYDVVGDIKYFASEENTEESLVEQFDRMYSHGGGWNPLDGFELNKDTGAIKYPGDPEMPPLATAKFRNQTVNVYQYAFVAIIEEDGSFEVARMD